MPAKLDRCVADVKNDPDIDNPWAVCNASIGEAFVANNEYPDAKQEGGEGSGVKGHTTADDENGGNGGDIESENLQDAEDWINAYGQGGMNDNEIRAKLEGMGIPHQTINQAFSNVQANPPEQSGFVDKRSDADVQKQIDDAVQTYIAQGQTPDTANRWANGMFGRKGQKKQEGGQGSGPQAGGEKKNVADDYSLKDWNPTTTMGKIFGPSILPGADWVTKKITGESSGSNWGGEEKPLTMTEAGKMIQEMKATPMTGSTKKMSGGSKGKAPKHWTPVDFNVLDKAQGQKPVPVPVGRAVQECEVCGIREMDHGMQDHPMIPPLPQDNGMPPPPNGQAPPMEPPMIPQEQEPFPQPNGMIPPNGMMNGMMPQMPPEQIPPPMPQEQMPPPSIPPPSMPPEMPPQMPMPQEQIPPIPTQNQEPQMQMQYTVSVPNSLSAQSIGGKKVNEMIREIERYFK